MHDDLASRQQARNLLAVTRRAFETFRSFPQKDVDRICYAMVEAGFRESQRLAEMAVEETGLGVVASKRAKNEFATRGLWAGIRDLKTCGLVSSDDARRVYEYADPFGIVAAIIPTTNPTSTALFKAIISLKARNGMVCSPHPRAARCIAESIRVVHEAAVRAGAPEGIVTCMDKVTLDGTDELMKHKGTDLILATGGMGLVRAAYASGKPAFGVGPGNSPAWIDRSADVAAAARAIVDSQTFDNGTICASEQSLVLDAPIREEALRAFRSLGAHLCNRDEAEKLGRIVVRGRSMNPDIVGQAPARIAEMAGFTVPRDTTVLLADCDGVGWDDPLSIEKLSPVLSVFTEDGWEAGCHRCIEVLRFGGMGHTLAIHCRDERIIREFAEKKPVNRIVVNSPSSQGAVGFTTNLVPSMTLGCGSFGGNITSDNISPLHLINVKRLAWVKPEYGTSSWTGSFPDAGPADGATKRGGGSPWLSRSSTPVAPDAAPSSSNGGRRARKPMWQPKKLPETSGSCEIEGITPRDVFSERDLDQIIRENLAPKDEGCPFGRSGDHPSSRSGRGDS